MIAISSGIRSQPLLRGWFTKSLCSPTSTLRVSVTSGLDFTSRPDAMHFELKDGMTSAKLHVLVNGSSGAGG